MNEETVEQAALDWFRDLDYPTLYGPDIAPGESLAERNSFNETILHQRLRKSLKRINPQATPFLIDEAIKKLSAAESFNLLASNRAAHAYLIDGIRLEKTGAQGGIDYEWIKFVDFENPNLNDWVVVNQFTVREQRDRRPDLVLFLNGLPIAIFEFKTVSEEKTIKDAFQQFQNYFKDIPSLFLANELLVISDGLAAKMGTLSSKFERFMSWRSTDGENLASRGSPELETLIKGAFPKDRLLDLIRHFVVFESSGRNDDLIEKKIAGYHQYFAVNKAIQSTLTAVGKDRRAGVIWHTQGSGKSLTMAFYSGKLIAHPATKNPTLVVLTDRNDLDDQLYGTFCRCKDLLRQNPLQAESKEHLQQLLNRQSGGVIFTTIQKFSPDSKGTKFPTLSDRENIIVIADEAHRSQYEFIDGFAGNLRNALPKASFIGFTGTPIEHEDKNTPAIFGDYIDIYDIHRAVEDRATVPVHYASRLAKIELNEQERPIIDESFEEVTEGEEETQRRKLKTRWARVEVLVGAENRIKQIAKDIVDHFEARVKSLEGKALIVCMSRRICVELYKQIIELRPSWHSDNTMEGVLKVIMTGSASDPGDWQAHIRSKSQRDEIAKRIKNPDDPLKIVIVRDMWLTGFDAPCLHTMYIDKPMKGHNLMQAIARVNRVFADKPGGLIVDYIGIADELKKALAEYSPSDRNETGIPISEVLSIVLEKLELIREMFHEIDYSTYRSESPKTRLSTIALAVDHILKTEDGQKRFIKLVAELSKAFAIAAATDEAREISAEVGFFQTVKAQFVKEKSVIKAVKDETIEIALQQLVSKAITSQEVIDIYALAGLSSPDISIFSDEFLSEVQEMDRKNLALELIKRIINDEIKLRSKKNVTQARKFTELLENAILKYKNRQIDVAKALSNFIDIAKHMRSCHTRAGELGLTEKEFAYFEALENSEGAQSIGRDALKSIAHDLMVSVEQNISVDWRLKENARARMRVAIKRTLRKHRFPLTEEVLETILRQAETE
jgi:type I restriction enzyme R subunit